MAVREPERRTFLSQGLSLSYLDWDNAEASPLLLLHGNKDHARSWDPVASELAQHFRVIALDLRGHGDSAWSPDGAYLSSYNLLDIVNLLDLLGPGPAVLMGHSFGGNIAARVAAAFPEKVSRLALVDGFGPPPAAYVNWARDGGVKRTREWVTQQRTAASRQPRLLARIEDGAERLMAGNPLLPADRALELARHGLRQVGEGFAWKYDPLVGPFVAEEFLVDNADEVWRDVTCPTLLCYGEKSWNTNPELDGRAQRLRDFRVVEIAEAGHWPHQEQVGAFLGVLRDFLGKVA